MKNQLSTTALLLAALAWPAAASAQSAAPAATPAKIGLINIQQAIASTAEGKKSFGEIQKKYQPRTQALQRQQEEIQAIQDQLQRQSTTLSDEERVRLTRDLEDKQKVFKRSQEDAQADYQNDNQEAIQRIGQKMVQVIANFAQENGYAFVVDYAQVQIFYYWDKAADITDQIVKRYDSTHPAEAVSAPAGQSSFPSPAAKTPPATRPAQTTQKPAANNKPKP